MRKPYRKRYLRKKKLKRTNHLPLRLCLSKWEKGGGAGEKGKDRTARKNRKIKKEKIREGGPDSGQGKVSGNT